MSQPEDQNQIDGRLKLPDIAEQRKWPAQEVLYEAGELSTKDTGIAGSYEDYADSEAAY